MYSTRYGLVTTCIEIQCRFCQVSTRKTHLKCIKNTQQETNHQIPLIKEYSRKCTNIDITFVSSLRKLFYLLL